MSKNIDKLSGNFVKSEKSIKRPAYVEAAEGVLKEICKELERDPKEYKPDLTVKIIDEYLQSVNNIGVMLYYYITNHVNGLDDKHSEYFTSNIINLLNYVDKYKNEKIYRINVDRSFDIIDENKEKYEERIKFITKLYDHSQLAIFQSNNLKSVLANSSSDLKHDINSLYGNVEKTQAELTDVQKNFEDISSNYKETKEKYDDMSENIKGTKAELRNIQKDYVAILGIFAAIVVTFVGGFSLSGNALKALKNIGPCEMTFFILLLAGFCYTILKTLFKFILRITKYNDEIQEKWYGGSFNLVIAGLILLDFAFYMAMKNVVVLNWLERLGFVFK